MQDFLFDLPDLRDKNFAAHNQESASLWEAFGKNAHGRVPIRLNNNPRMLLLDPAYNTRGLTYREYMHDPDLMAQVQLEWQYWNRFLLPTDAPRGFPEQWAVAVDFENHYDAAWFGCPIHFRNGQVPDATPILNDDNKRMMFDRGLPDPFGGEWAERACAFIDHWREQSAQGWTFLERPVARPEWAPFESNDGVFTVAACLRGPTGLCTDMLGDPGYAHELMAYVYEALAMRRRAWRQKMGRSPGKQDGFFWADDSIALLSTEQYREFVLPWHKRIYDEFATEKDRGMHLCGDVQRHLPIIKEELGVVSFDTGYPVDFGALRRDLGPEVLISGGPRVALFVEDEPKPVVDEVQRILASGILEGGRFILQEGNNLPPQTRLDVCEAFYEAGKRFGRLQ
jgi:hypothetical protein